MEIKTDHQAVPGRCQEQPEEHGGLFRLVLQISNGFLLCTSGIAAVIV